MCSPFSSGSEAADWVYNNCDKCVRSYKPIKDGEWPSFKTMQQYCSIGKECKMKLAIDIGFITGEIPVDIAEQIGFRNEHKNSLKQTCLFYSDNDDDGYKPKPRPKPDNTPDNQMVMPFIIEQTLKSEHETV